MRDDPLYLTKNSHGVYYYRRPIIAADQAFWRGPTGQPKKEWIRSLRTKDRREAIEKMLDAADMYEAERNENLRRHMALASREGAQECARDREEREAAERLLAEQSARREARRELRVERRRRAAMTTAELSPEDAAWHDLLRERDAELATLREAVGKARDSNAVLAIEMGRVTVGEGPTVEKLIAAYEADKAPGWSGSSKKAIQPVFRLLREMFPGRAIDEISRADARSLVVALEALPANLGKRKELRGLTVPEAIEKGRELGLPTIGPKTINDGYLLHIASMWNWAVKEQWTAAHPFKGLSVHDPVDDAERRVPFKPEQLTTLFSSAPWTGPWERGGAKPGAFWVPLLCLFHGLRNAEAAGLRVQDVGEVDGLPVLHIVPYEGRPIKTAGSRGDLPLHPELLQIGFLEYVAERREAGEYLLFPEGTPNGRGQVAAKLAERFSAKVKRLGLAGRKLGMHSFRHNFEDRLRAAEIPERTALALSRRAEIGSSRLYGEGVSIRQKTEALGKVSYRGLDLSHLIPT